jgi:dihydroorotase
VTEPADTITIRKPDDWHLHLRDGPMMQAVLPYTAAQFGRAIVMPNLSPPVITVADAIAYRQRIIAALPTGVDFEPLMTCYLTDTTDPVEVASGFADGVFAAVKLYPARATTNSDYGVTAWENVRPVLARMEKIGMPLLVHGEEADPDIDIFDREAMFIERVLSWVISDYPELKLVLEHITTADGADFVRESGSNIAATVTPHHLMLNRNDLLAGGLRPHHYCLPIVKRERHRQALRGAVGSGDASFFLGTDSAPHPVGDKESDCGCAGIFNAPAAMEVYAQAFDEIGALDRLEGFASLNGPAFYGREPNSKMITLRRSPFRVIEQVNLPENISIRPFYAGEDLPWSLVTV